MRKQTEFCSQTEICSRKRTEISEGTVRYASIDSRIDE